MSVFVCVRVHACVYVCLCVCVFMCVHVCVCVYVCLCVRCFMWVNSCVCVHICVREQMCVCVYPFFRVRLFSCVSMSSCVRVCVCVHVYVCVCSCSLCRSESFRINPVRLNKVGDPECDHPGARSESRRGRHQHPSNKVIFRAKN